MTRQLPALFKAEMVRAILAGTKTNTRRVNKLRDFGPSTTPRYDWEFRDRRGLWHSVTTRELIERHCPYGKPGDELYVKENFQSLLADGVQWNDADYKTGRGYRINYVATSGRVEYYDQSTDNPFCSKVTPSIYMPRWASRIRLTVTEVRVERVQDITDEDAKAEGVEAQMVDGYGCWKNYELGEGTWCNSARDSFGTLWRSINDGREGCAWDVNPFVWVVRFKINPGHVPGGATPLDSSSATAPTKGEAPCRQPGESPGGVSASKGSK